MLAEAGIAVVLLAVTTVLTQTEPGRTEEEAKAANPSSAATTGPSSGAVTLDMPFDTGGQNGKGVVRVELDPARVGANDMHLYVERPDGKAFDIPEVKVAFTQEAKDIGPLPVVPDHITTGHWSASGGADPDRRGLGGRRDRPDLRHRPGDRLEERADRLNRTMADQSIPEARTPEATRGAPGGSGPLDSENTTPRQGVSRRRLLGTAGATGLVLGAAGGAAGYAAAPSAATPLTSLGDEEVMFHGKHQPGITTPMQACGHLVAFDLAAGAGRREAAALLRRWSETARRLMAGSPPVAVTRTWPGTRGPPRSPPPSDSGTVSSAGPAWTSTAR
ncbi:Dyp-type peroxidase [Streptomyces thinghirensis]|nr:Dyp-type peroxidase [Streptomyces thinghirensis]